MSGLVPVADATPRWEPAPAGPAPRAGGVDVWQVDLDHPPRPLAQLLGDLSPDERVRGEAFVFPQDRRRFIAARGMLRWLLAGYLDHRPGTLDLRTGPNGKPELATPSGGAPIRFNLSRSRGGALYAVTRGRRIGVDLEVLRPIPEAETIAQRWFSPRERAALAAVPAAVRTRAFLHAWTCKEAYAKAIGIGITEGFEHLEVALAMDGPPALRAIDDVAVAVAAASWTVVEPPPTPGCVATLVVEGDDVSPRFWSFSLARAEHQVAPRSMNTPDA